MKHAIIVISFFLLVGLWSGAMNFASASIVVIAAASLLAFNFREKLISLARLKVRNPE